MLYYWYRIARIFVSKYFQKEVAIEEELTRTFRVGLFDCDGLRVMSAFKYVIYMDFMRWELMTRSKALTEILKKGMAPALGSQKVIYRKPIKLWTRFTVTLQTLGWDEKWIYNSHRFEQNGELKAVGYTRALLWKKDKQQLGLEILRSIGVKNLDRKPPDWVLALFENDKEIITKDLH